MADNLCFRVGEGSHLVRLVNLFAHFEGENNAGRGGVVLAKGFESSISWVGRTVGEKIDNTLGRFVPPG